MTVVGKILVFLVLVCSLAVGGFAVMDFTARTHWADQYEKLSKKYQIVQASSVTYKAEAEKLAKEKQDLNATLAAVGGKDLAVEGPVDPDQAARRAAKLLADRAKTIDDLKETIKGLTRDLASARSKTTEYDAVAKVSQRDVERRQADVERMRGDLKSATDKNTLLIRDMNELRDRAVGAEIESRSLKDMNKRLEGELQDMARTMTRLRSNTGSNGAAARNGLNPPPENVEGLVSRADGNLVTLTIGSDAGLVRGHTMEVFRLGQNPKYIGRIKIVDVTPTKAVGRAEGRLAGPMQVGDRVASRIMGGN